MSRKHRNKQQLVPHEQRISAQFRSITASHFSGPIPPPEALEKYNQIIPNAAERILAMAESQSVHRQHLEKIAVEANAASQKRGPVFGFIIALVTIIGGFYLIYLGKDGPGLGAIFTTLAALAGVFIVGKIEQRKDLSAKAAAFPPVQG